MAEGRCAAGVHVPSRACGMTSARCRETGGGAIVNNAPVAGVIAEPGHVAPCRRPSMAPSALHVDHSPMACRCGAEEAADGRPPVGPRGGTGGINRCYVVPVLAGRVLRQRRRPPRRQRDDGTSIRKALRDAPHPRDLPRCRRHLSCLLHACSGGTGHHPYRRAVPAFQD